MEFDNISNLPVLEFVGEIIDVFDVTTFEECKYKLSGVDKFEIINFDNVALNSARAKMTIFGDDSFKQVQFNNGTFTLEEKYKNHCTLIQSILTLLLTITNRLGIMTWLSS